MTQPDHTRVACGSHRYREDEGASSELRLVAWNKPRHRITGKEMSRMPESPV